MDQFPHNTLAFCVENWKGRNLKQKADSVSANQTNILYQAKCTFQAHPLVNRDDYSGNILRLGKKKKLVYKNIPF